MQNTKFKTTALCYLLLFFIPFSYGQSPKKADIILTILKDSIENNSIVTVEFFNHSNQNYYLPLDTSMNRYLGFNSYYEAKEHFSLKEIWYDEEMNRGNFRGSDTSDCMDVQQSVFSGKLIRKKEEFKNVDILFLESNTSVRLQIPIQFIKREFYSCSLFYQSTDSLFTYFQLNYQVSKEKMEQLREKDTMYNRSNLENKGYVLYTYEIQSNIVPLKISKAMRAFMNDPFFGKEFLEIEKE
ncbi:hypothetical protein [Myroides odoratus]|uniref:hypothetical protein n=1 Tax=Myroides odoratus TaxID=256 RepID=UPI0039AEEAF9